jgi:hypothetical protein
MSRGSEIVGVERDGFVSHSDASLGRQIVELEDNMSLSFRALTQLSEI